MVDSTTGQLGDLAGTIVFQAGIPKMRTKRWDFASGVTITENKTTGTLEFSFNAGSDVIGDPDWSVSTPAGPSGNGSIFAAEDLTINAEGAIVIGQDADSVDFRILPIAFGAPTPTLDEHLATKAYVDAVGSAGLPSIASNTFLANLSGGAAVPTATAFNGLVSTTDLNWEWNAVTLYGSTTCSLGAAGSCDFVGESLTLRSSAGPVAITSVGGAVTVTAAVNEHLNLVTSGTGQLRHNGSPISGGSYTAGDGLTLTGSVFSVDLTDTTIFSAAGAASRAMVTNGGGIAFADGLHSGSGASGLNCSGGNFQLYSGAGDEVLVEGYDTGVCYIGAASSIVVGAPTVMLGVGSTDARIDLDKTGSSRRARSYDGTNTLARTVTELASAVTDTVVGTYTLSPGGAMSLGGFGAGATILGSNVTASAAGAMTVNGTTGTVLNTSAGRLDIGANSVDLGGYGAYDRMRFYWAPNVATSATGVQTIATIAIATSTRKRIQATVRGWPTAGGAAQVAYFDVVAENLSGTVTIYTITAMTAVSGTASLGTLAVSVSGTNVIVTTNPGAATAYTWRVTDFEDL